MTPSSPQRPSPTVRAVVWLGGSSFDVRSFPMPEPGPGEVVVEVALATVCGSDLHSVAGRRSAPCPSILGHEAVGRVVAVGGAACDHRDEPLAAGDRVVWGVTVSCHRCDRCRAGRSAKCRHLRKVGHEAVEGSWPLSGSYATHVLLPAGATVVRVPDVVADAAAATSACAMATVMACLDAAGPLEGRRVLVSGLGMLGVSACVALADRGVASIAGVDPDPHGRALARRFGADDVVAPPQERVGLGGDPFDVVIELSGAARAVAAAIDAAEVGGHVVLGGSVAPDGTVAVDPEQVVRRHLTIVGVHNYEPRHLVRAVELLAATSTDLGELVAPPVTLDELPAVLAGVHVPAGSAPARRAAVDPRVRSGSGHPTRRD